MSTLATQEFSAPQSGMPSGAPRMGDDAESHYRRALVLLNKAGVPYLVGGAYAQEYLTGIAHQTKDLDLFVRRSDCRWLLATLAQAGWQTELVFPHWLAKAHERGHIIDVIFSSGNGEAPVDDVWLDKGVPVELFDTPVRLCPIEEAIWVKSFVMERERYDGADVTHLLRFYGDRLDWPRLLSRFGSRWPVLLSHVVLFGFVYPDERKRIPSWVVRELTARLTGEWEQVSSPPRVCRGGLLSRAQYSVDLEEWQYLDARLYPLGKMTPNEAAAWTDAAPERCRLSLGGRRRL